DLSGDRAGAASRTGHERGLTLNRAGDVEHAEIGREATGAEDTQHVLRPHTRRNKVHAKKPHLLASNDIALPTGHSEDPCPDREGRISGINNLADSAAGHDTAEARRRNVCLLRVEPRAL